MSRFPGRYTRQVLRPGGKVITVLSLVLLGPFFVGAVVFVRMIIVKWTTEVVLTSDLFDPRI